MKIGIGTVQFGLRYGIGNQHDICSQQEISSILEFAKNKKIKIVDTAPTYGDAENRLGATQIMNDFDVVTKVSYEGVSFDGVSPTLRCNIQKSFKSLRMKSLYGIICHDADAINTNIGREVLNELKRMKADGLCQKIGISIYDPDDVKLIIQDPSLDLVQLPFNLFDQRFLASGALRRLKDNGVEVHARSIFLQGLLLLSDVEVMRLNPNALGAKRLLSALASANGLSILELAVSYVNSFSEIDRMVVGVNSVKQLKDIVLATNTDLSNLDVSALAVSDTNVIDPRQWG